MSKTAKSSADVFTFPTFDTAVITDQVREFAEKGVAQSKEAYSRIKDQADTAQKAFETTLDTAHSSATELSRKAIAALRANTEAGFSHFEALVGVKSVGEAFELQAAFLRKQAETFSDQAKEFQTVATRAAEDLAKPAKTVFEKTVKDSKAI
ncbi:MAG: phasin [Phyllobacterium sp.]